MSANEVYHFVKDNISFSKKLEGNKKINQIRKILEKRENANIEILKNDAFLDFKNEGNIICPQDENKKNLSEIASEDKYVYLESQSVKKVELRLNNNFYKESKYIDSTLLNEFRNNEKIKENFVFTRKNNIIDFPEEKEFKIIDIIEEENEKKIINLLERLTIEKIKANQSIEEIQRKYIIIFQEKKQTEFTNINASYEKIENNNEESEEKNEKIENNNEELEEKIEKIEDNNEESQEKNEQIEDNNEESDEKNEQIEDNNEKNNIKNQSEKEKNKEYLKNKTNNNLNKSNNKSNPKDTKYSSASSTNNSFQNPSIQTNLNELNNRGNKKEEIKGNRIQSKINDNYNANFYIIENSNLNEETDKIFSIVLMGPPKSGKTSFINTLVNL